MSGKILRQSVLVIFLVSQTLASIKLVLTKVARRQIRSMHSEATAKRAILINNTFEIRDEDAHRLAVYSLIEGILNIDCRTALRSTLPCPKDLCLMPHPECLNVSADPRTLSSKFKSMTHVILDPKDHRSPSCSPNKRKSNVVSLRETNVHPIHAC